MRTIEVNAQELEGIFIEGQDWSITPENQTYMTINVSKEGIELAEVFKVQLSKGLPNNYWQQYESLTIQGEGDRKILTGFDRFPNTQPFVSLTLTKIGVDNHIENNQIVITSHQNCNVWDALWAMHPWRITNEDECLEYELLRINPDEHIDVINQARDLPHDHNIHVVGEVL